MYLLPAPVPNQPKEADPAPVHLKHKVGHRARRSRSGLLLDKVGEEPGEGALANLLLEVVQAKVKLMVTRDGGVDSEPVEGVHHVAALGLLAPQGWREGIP